MGAHTHNTHTRAHTFVRVYCPLSLPVVKGHMQRHRLSENLVVFHKASFHSNHLDTAIVSIIIMAHYTSSKIKFYQERKVKLLILFICNVKLTTSSLNSTKMKTLTFPINLNVAS